MCGISQHSQVRQTLPLLVEREMILRSRDKITVITFKQFVPFVTPIGKTLFKPIIYFVFVFEIDTRSFYPVFCFLGSGVKG
ncbi:hypothetical protein D3C78_1393430 [compost metagenome]